VFLDLLGAIEERMGRPDRPKFENWGGRQPKKQGGWRPGSGKAPAA
jgi:hypothetical protein